MQEYRSYRMAELRQLELDTQASSDTYILLQDGRLLLRELEKRLDLQVDTLVFLNMCELAQIVASLSDSLIDGFLRKGAVGVIGTEIPMLDAFADAFSRELFGRLLFGSSGGSPEKLGGLSRALRCKYLDLNNPLGFAYSYFGDVSLTLGLDKPEKLEAAA